MAAYNDKITQVAYEQIITKDRKLVQYKWYCGTCRSWYVQSCIDVYVL